LRTSLYDLRDTLESWWDVGLKETLEFITENKDILPDIDLDFLQKSFDIIPDGLQESFWENFETIKNLIPDLSETNFENIGSSWKEILENVDGEIKNFLDNNVGGLIENFKN